MGVFFVNNTIFRISFNIILDDTSGIKTKLYLFRDKKMKRYSAVFIVVIFTFLVCSCNQSIDPDEDNQSSDEYYGTWVDAGYEDNQIILIRSDDLDENKYGFIINPDGEFIERKNSGWCGTLPISYANFEGRWSGQPDDFLEITVAYWGGVTSYQLEIVSISSNQLHVIFHHDN